MITDEDVDEFLEHFGVKGQKWGVRRNRESSGGKEKTPSRKERRAEKKAAREKAIQEHLDSVFKEASTKPMSAIMAGTRSGNVLMTGEEFTANLLNGMQIDPSRTYVYGHFGDE